MALTYIGETEFRQSGPVQWQQSLWDLDTLTVPYSGAEFNLNSFLDTLEKGQPSDTDQDMLLIDWRAGGSKAWPQVDLVYTGKKNGNLPPVKHQSGSAVQSSSSATSSAIFPAVATQPVTVTYYASTNTITVLSRSSTTTEEPSDPATITSVITWSINAEQPGSSMPEIVTWLLENAFVQGIIEGPPEVEEIVSGDFGSYWRITKRKTRTLFPYAPAS